MKRLSNDELIKLSSRRKSPSNGGLEEEIAGLSQGNPTIYDSYMKKSRYKMWLIALGA